jgi:cytochrome o ubiquinol oxidase subunit 1
VWITYIWSLQIAGVGTLLSGVNLLTTIIKMRAPGMTLMKMPIFTWTALCTNVLIVAAFPVLTAVLAMLALDRYAGTNFFTNDSWRQRHDVRESDLDLGTSRGVHPDPCRRSAFSPKSPRRSAGKRLFGYASMVYATVVITVLAYLVWLHHFFTMGSGASVNSFFGITTMIISIPTGAKIFNWLFTMYRGRIEFEVPMLWTVGFIVTFAIGGMTGVLLAVPPADFVAAQQPFPGRALPQRHHRRCAVRLFAGINYWFPKAFGFASIRSGASARSGSG